MAMRVFHKNGKMRFFQKHFPECIFTEKILTLILPDLTEVPIFWEKYIQENVLGKNVFGKNSQHQ